MATDRTAKRKTKQTAALIIILAVLAVIIWFFVIPYIERITPGKDRVDLPSYLGLSGPEDAFVVLGETPSPSKAIVRDGTVYWDYDSVKLNFSDMFWANIDEGVLLFTTADEVIRADAGELSYVRHAEAAPGAGIEPETVNTDTPVFFTENGRGYVSLDFAKQFSNFTYELFTNPYRVQIYAKSEVYKSLGVIKDRKLRVSMNIKSGIISDLTKGDTVYLLENNGDWSKVRTEDALIGYVENRYLSGEPADANIVVSEDFVPPAYTSLTNDKPICAAWHLVTVADANASLSRLTESAWSLDVVSPTWYKLVDGTGVVDSIAWKSYVATAHAQGLSVWPLVDDFASGIDSDGRAAFLASADSRNTFVSYLIGQANALGFDGINLDFEAVPEGSSSGFEQLLRELSVACRAHGLVFSIDNYPPRAHTEHYNRGLQGQIADYVIIMGYDEHWGVSSGAGSVASLPFVLDAINQTKAVVPANKIINAVPFYSRLWATNQDDGTLRIAATPGMAWQDKWLSDNDVTPVWNEELGQNYAELLQKNILYQIWLEDLDSMRARVDAMKGLGLGGVAGWQLGLEKPEVWDIFGAWTRG